MQALLFQPDVEKVHHREASSFYADHHYIGTVGYNAFTVGLRTHQGDLRGCVSFGVPATHAARSSWFGADLASEVYELTRLAICDELKASWFVARALEYWLRYRERASLGAVKALISYADTREGHHGGVYQAMSWIYCGTTEPTTGFIDADGRPVHRRRNGQNMVYDDLQRIRTSPKHRYVKILGSSRQRRRMRKALCYEVMTYPKTEERP